MAVASAAVVVQLMSASPQEQREGGGSSEAGRKVTFQCILPGKAAAVLREMGELLLRAGLSEDVEVGLQTWGYRCC